MDDPVNNHEMKRLKSLAKDPSQPIRVSTKYPRLVTPAKDADKAKPLTYRHATRQELDSALTTLDPIDYVETPSDDFRAGPDWALWALVLACALGVGVGFWLLP